MSEERRLAVLRAIVQDYVRTSEPVGSKALLERPDSIIVATVSAIYGLGDPNEYFRMVLHLVRGDHLEQRELIRRLAEAIG